MASALLVMISAQLLATYAACPRPESQLRNHQEVFGLFLYFCSGADVDKIRRGC